MWEKFKKRMDIAENMLHPKQSTGEPVDAQYESMIMSNILEP